MTLHLFSNTMWPMTERTSLTKNEVLHRLGNLWTSYWQDEKKIDFEKFDLKVLVKFEKEYDLAFKVGCSHYEVFSRFIEVVGVELKQDVFEFLVFHSNMWAKSMEERLHSEEALFRIYYESHFKDPYLKE